MHPKEFFIEQIEKLIGPAIDHYSILDLGSGQSEVFVPFLKRHPHITYVGVEPSPVHAEQARRLLASFPNATIYSQLAYDHIPGGPFDLSISLSVLEHVKQLERFIANSAAMVKSGGRVIHRYDLGHALFPSSLKERIQVFLGNKFPTILPEHKFVRYVDPAEVARLFESCGISVDRITYHQMPNHKRFLKAFVPSSPEEVALAQELLNWEFRISPHLGNMPKMIREQLFPAICVWGVKK